MTARIHVAAIAAACITFAHATSFAQVINCSALDVPRTLTYQGAIKTLDGKPLLDGPYSITVHLYSDEAGAQEIWKDTYDVAVCGGIFNLLLGAGAHPLPIAEMNRPLWLGTQVGDAPVIEPLAALSASPYALAIADKSVTAEKMATDYVGSISINGQKISGRGERLNIVTGSGIIASVDPGNNAILLDASPGRSYFNKGVQSQANSTITGNMVVVQNTCFNTGLDNLGHTTTTTFGSNSASIPGILNLQQGLSSGGHQVILQAPSSSMSGDAAVILPASSGTLVLQSRSVASGTGLSGGGDLSNDRTISLDVTHGNSWSASQLLPANSTQGNNLISAINSGNSGTINTAMGGTGISSSGSAGNYLRSNGTSWTSTALQAADLPAGSASYIQNGSSLQSNANFNVSGNGTLGGNLVLSNNGTPGQIQLQGSGSGISTLRAGAQGATTINYVLPIAQPAANQVLAATSVSGSGPFAVTLGWASAGGGGAPLFASKSADQNYSSTSLTNDTHLAIALVANATYIFDGFLSFEDVNQDVSAGAKVAFTAPTGSTVKWGVNTSGGVFVTKNVMNSSGIAISSIAIENAVSGDENFVYVKGIAITGSTPGNLQLQCAKGNGTTLRLHQNSYLTATRVQ